MPTGLLYTGNALDILRELADESVHACITSPPYWGLRDYTICSCRQGRVQHESSTLVGSQAGTPSEFGPACPACPACSGTGYIKGLYQVWGGNSECKHDWQSMSVKGKSGGPSDKQKSNKGSWFSDSTCSTCSTCSAWYGSLGNEPTPEMFIEHLVMIFREVKRVLRNDGTLWVNIGDSYSGAGYSKHTNTGGVQCDIGRKKHVSTKGMKAKDLVGIPWMLAFALRADGWYLRQDIIWAKPNPMPESVTDRCVKAHEYMFLLSKSREYYFDHVAIQEDAVYAGKKVKLGPKSLSKGQATGMNVTPHGNGLVDSVEVKEKRNKRSVWWITTKPFNGAHFATFPPDLVEIPIRASTSEYGVCAVCGTSYNRVTERCTSEPVMYTRSTQPYNTVEKYGTGAGNSGVAERAERQRNGENGIRTVGWEKSCKCIHATETAGQCTVLDPFSGAATTGLVALSLGRNYIGIEQNPEYNSIAEKRLADVGLDALVV